MGRDSAARKKGNVPGKHLMGILTAAILLTFFIFAAEEWMVRLLRVNTVRAEDVNHRLTELIGDPADKY